MEAKPSDLSVVRSEARSMYELDGGCLRRIVWKRGAAATSRHLTRDTEPYGGGCSPLGAGAHGLLVTEYHTSLVYQELQDHTLNLDFSKRTRVRFT